MFLIIFFVCQVNKTVDELNEKLKQATEDCNTKDNTISSLQKELSEKEQLSTKVTELQQVSVVVLQL